MNKAFKRFNRLAVSFAIAGAFLWGAALPGAAETCSNRVINGETVVICCDGNGVCYRK